MKEMVIKLIGKYGKQMCTFAIFIGGMTLNSCRWIFYQPEEPEGLGEFIRKKKNNK